MRPALARPKLLRRGTLATLFALLGAAVASKADAEPCPQGATFSRGCKIDVVVGPVLASGRVIGMGGAYSAIADGFDGYAVNSAAPAVRQPWSESFAEYDVDFGVTLPGAFSTVDFENRGDTHGFNYGGGVFATLGVNAQLGAWGFGVESDAQRFAITGSGTGSGTGSEAGNGASYAAGLFKARALVARQFLDGDLVVGAGARYVAFFVTDGANRTLATISGFAPEAGLLYRPEGQPFRLGATYRAEVRGSAAADGAATAGGLVLPGYAHQPWEVDLGFALSAGKRPLNVRWSNPHDEDARLRAEIVAARERRAAEARQRLAAASASERPLVLAESESEEARLRAREDAQIEGLDRFVRERQRARYRAMSRECVLLSLGVLWTGPTDDGVSLSSFFEQVAARSGRVSTLSLRAGIETEVVPGWIRSRVGTYVEPSRFTETADFRAFRQHLTAGFDARLFAWTAFGLLPDDSVFRLSGVIDVAPRWSNWGLSIGLWH